jgi:dihydroxyacetone kinase
MLNNLGGLTAIEIFVAARFTLNYLGNYFFKFTFKAEKKINVQRVYCGTFMSSLEMVGLSVSLVAVTTTDIAHLDSKTEAPAWPNQLSLSPPKFDSHKTQAVGMGNTVDSILTKDYSKDHGNDATYQKFRKVLTSVCESVVNSSKKLTELDSVVGDGDMGMNLESVSGYILKKLDFLPFHDIPETFSLLSKICQRHLGGTSGPLYSVFFLRISNSLKSSSTMDVSAWAAAVESGVNGIVQLGSGQLGDRTMLDSLIPLMQQLKQLKTLDKETAAAVVNAIQTAAEGTAKLLPKRGRSSYLKERALGTPDPGAVAVAIIVQCVFQTLF